MEEEKIRIFNNRGETRQSNLDKKQKIFVRARMYPALTISRSLGDLLAHHIGVTSRPDIAIHDIHSGDKFVTIASNGVWNHLGTEDIGEIVSEFGMKDPGVSCEMVVQKINDMCQIEREETDDRTLIISYLGNKNV